MNATQNLSVQVELIKMFGVKANSNGTEYRNCHVKFTDPSTKEESIVWARIWETSVINGAKVGDMLGARLETWTGTDGVTRESLTVLGGSDASQASASLFKNALSAVTVSAPDLNKP